VTVRKLFPLAAAFGLWVAGPAAAQLPMPTPAAKAENQKLAEAVAEKLRSSGAVPKGAKVNVETRDGVVDLSGSVATKEQHDAILRALTKMPGLKRIESGIQIADASPIKRAGGQVDSPAPPGGFGPVTPYPMAPPPMPFPTAAAGEPLPLNGMPAMAPVDPAGPRLPPYAWPTYAPYNNYSRVAYPQSYPYNAFPYIGPFYPFPKVPLGWRKVVLEWEDGHWYYGKLSSPHDFWRVKFW
jgi:BON domain